MNVLFLNNDDVCNFDDENKAKGKSDSWRIYYANNTVQAMEIITSHSIDVVVADIKNPTEDTKFLANMKHRYPEIGRILLSGNNGGNIGTLAWPIVHQHIEKPFNSVLLRNKINSVVSVLKKH